jgi:hypothetical protein
MLELIARLGTLLGELGREERVRPGCMESSLLTSRDWTRIRGMGDILLAMEERVATIRALESSPRHLGTVAIDPVLWERA